jgi:hypothetical protein
LHEDEANTTRHQVRLAKDTVRKFDSLQAIAGLFCPIADQRQADSPQPQNNNDAFSGKIAADYAFSVKSRIGKLL